MSNDVHRFYDFCDEIFSLLEKKVFILKTMSARYKSEKYTLKILIIIFDILYIPIVSYFRFRFDFIFLREFNTLSFLISAILLLPIRKKLLLNVNHNFQKANCSKIHFLGVKMLDFLGYRFFLFEGDSAPFKINKKLISIPFPIKSFSKETSRKGINEKIKIGFVGGYRNEKNIEELLIKLDSVYESLDFTPVLGTNKVELLDSYASKGWETFDTSNFESYCKAMDIVDVMVFSYDNYNYYYRHSGVLTDGIKKRKIIVAPNYPYFERQLTNPNNVGLLYDSLEEISNCLEEAKLLEPDFESYFKFRSYKNIIIDLNTKLREL